MHEALAILDAFGPGDLPIGVLVDQTSKKFQLVVGVVQRWRGDDETASGWLRRTQGTLAHGLAASSTKLSRKLK